jgi:serine/threonine-protein kinase
MGVVYRAHDTLLERVVALKIISTSIEDNPELRERFFREARAAGQLSHRNIITIHDLGEHEGQPYLAMEFLTGEDLQHRLSRQEPMSLRRKLEVAAEICDGLAYAHRRGLVHRDVKPANIFITDDGVVKLLDFGLARMVASELTRSNMMMGTLNYMAPEQVRGERTDHRADIFSFGVVLYEMLSGRKAFQGDSFATTIYKILQDVPEPLLNIDPSLPHELAWLVEKALAKPKDERYQELTDMSRDLAIIRQHLSGSEIATMAGSAFGGGRTPSDPPSPRQRRAGAEGRGVSEGSHADAPRSSGSGSRSAGSGGRPLSATTTFAATPVATDRVPSGMRPAARYWSVLAGTGLAVIGVTALAAWLTLRPSSQDTSMPPQAAETASPIAAPPPPSPAPALPLDRTARTATPTSVPPSPTEERSSPRGVTDSPAELRRANDARQRMARAKASARDAGSAAIGSAAYTAALAAEREGNRQHQGKHFAEATAKFYEASGLFRSAELTPSTMAAESKPPQQPQRETKPQPSPPPPAVAPPVQGPPPVVPTGTGQVPLPAGAEPKLPPPPAPNRPPAAAAPSEGAASPAAASESAIRDLLKRYQRALESRNIETLKSLWPTLRGAQEDAIRREFQFARRIEVELDEPALTVSGASATTTSIRRYKILTTDNQMLDRTSRMTMTVRRTGNEWVIDRVQFEQIR